MISKDDIQRINDLSKIEDVVGEFVKLKKRGTNFIGLCPFHNEKTPSFTVSPTKNIYKCFGCGAAGGSVNFIMHHEQFTYPEALKYLAAKYNIEINEKEISIEEKQIEDEKQLIYILHEMAQKFYADFMMNFEEGRTVGLSYFEKRKFSEKSIKKFGLGYSPEYDKGFTEYAISKGYSVDVLYKAGLISETKNQDIFRGRVIFPIYSISGRVLGFGARIMKTDAKIAKYLNSPETTIYQKSKVLYGLHLAKNSIVKNDNCYLVEGYTDVISLHQAGVENVVSSSGTSLTEEQIRLIKRYTANVTIVFDGDIAGVKASFRGIDLLLDAGMNVKVIMLPENEDPDTFATANRDKDINEFFSKNSETFISYKAKFLNTEAGNDPIKKAEIIKDIVQSIARLPDGISRALFVRECSDIIKISEEILSHEISKLLRQKFLKEGASIEEQQIISQETYTTEKQLIQSDYDNSVLERRIASLLLNYYNKDIPVVALDENLQAVQTTAVVCDFIIRSLLKDNFLFRDTYSSKVFQEFKELQEQNKEMNLDEWVTSIENNSFRKFIVDLITSPYTLSQNWAKEFNVKVLSTDNATEILTKDVKSTIAYYRLFRLQEELLRIDKELSEIKDIETQNNLLSKRQIIQSVMQEIAKKLGTTRID